MSPSLSLNLSQNAVHHYICHRFCPKNYHKIWWFTKFVTKFGDKFGDKFITKDPGGPTSMCRKRSQNMRTCVAYILVEKKKDFIKGGRGVTILWFFFSHKIPFFLKDGFPKLYIKGRENFLVCFYHICVSLCNPTCICNLNVHICLFVFKHILSISLTSSK